MYIIHIHFINCHFNFFLSDDMTEFFSSLILYFCGRKGLMFDCAIRHRLSVANLFNTSHILNILNISNCSIREICLPLIDQIFAVPHAFNIFGWAVDPVQLNIPGDLN